MLKNSVIVASRVGSHLSYAHFICAIWVVCVCISGCGSSKPAPALNVAEPEDPSSIERIAYPEFVNWNQFPVGTTVVRHKEIFNDKGSVYETTTLKLVAKAEDSLTVQSQVTVKREDSLQENPPIEFKHPAKVRLIGTEEQMALPSVTAKKTGEEKVSLLDQEVMAEVFEWEESTEAGPMKVKLWRSDEVPGRMVREETLIVRDGDKSVETIQELKVPEQVSASNG